MNNIFKKIISNKSGSTIIMISLLVMGSILVVGLSLGSIVTNGLKSSKSQANATKAYFAAEAGAERILWEIRKNDLDLATTTPVICTSGQYVNNSFNGCVNGHPTATAEYILLNEARFYIRYIFSAPTTTLTSFGEYKGTRRAVELKY